MFKNPRSFTAVKKLVPRAHLEMCWDLQKSIDYCMKDGDYTEIGTRPLSAKERGKKGGDKEIERWAYARECINTNRLEDLPDQIFCLHLKSLEYAQQWLDRRQRLPDLERCCGMWIWGPPGVGKSRQARIIAGDTYFIKPMNKWFDGYAREDIVIIDDVKPEQCDFLNNHMLHWLDIYPFKGEVKGGTISLRPRQFILTSNHHPDECFKVGVTYEAMMRRLDVLYLPERGAELQPQHAMEDKCPPRRTSFVGGQEQWNSAKH